MALLRATLLSGQPTCSISIGPDQTICQGSSATLQGPSGFGNMLWSTGETSSSISVGSAGDYWCQVSYPSGNLVTNGDFSAGNTGFSSQFTYSLFTVQNEGMYTVGPNASWYHNQFQGTGNGNFLIANAGYGSWSNGQLDVWCQTIPCCPGQTYTLSFKARTLTNELPARAIWYMDGVMNGWPDYTFPAYSAGWQQYTTTWTAGPGQTSVNACIHLTSGDGVGDDLGIDDINISGTIVLRDTVHVNVTPLPVVDLGPDLSLCTGDETTLDATVPGGGYVWQDGSTLPTFQVNTGGTYSVTVTAQNCSNSDQVNVAYLPRPVVQLGPDTVLCAGSSLTLSTGGPGLTCLWQDGSQAASRTINTAGLYWVEVGNGTCSTRDSIVVGYNPLPTVSLGNDTTFCAGDALTLDATWPGATYTWQDGSTTPTLQVSAPGTYRVTVDLNGCTAQDSLQVAVTPLPQVDLGPDTTVCPGNALTFSAATPGAGYVWNDGSSLPQLTTTVPGTYSVQVTVNGCSASDAATLTNFNLQTVNLGADIALCAGSTARVGVTVPGATYTWNTGASTDSITIATAGTYWLDATLNGCSVRDSIAVSVTALPVIDLGPDKQVCPGAQAVLDATTPGSSYVWSNGATAPVISAGAGTWSVQVTVNNCSASDTVVITESAPPTVDLGPDTTLCPGNPLILSAGAPSNNYVWSTGATGPGITVSAATTVSVTATDAAGCTATDAITVSYANPGTLSLGMDTTICAGSLIMLDATLPNATGYTWNTGAVNPTLSVGNAGTYWAEVEVGACLVRDTIVVMVAPLPSVAIGNDTTLCQGETLALQVAPSTNQLTWKDGSSGNAFTVTSAGDYWVAVTNPQGCSDTATIHVDYLNPGALDLGTDTSLCAGTSLLLDAGLAGGTTVWSGALSANGATALASTAGTYIATTSVAGCSVADSITISILPLPVVDLGPDQHFCAGSSVQLVASGSALQWDDGSTAANRTVMQGGVYWVQSTSNGCTATDSILVTEIPLPSFSLGPDTAICTGSQVLVNASVPVGTYLWNDGSTAAQRTLGPGNWSVLVTAASCTSGDSILIGDIPVPILAFPADTTLCQGASWLLDVAQPGCSYQWTTGATTSALLITGPGNYGVTVDRSGCTATAQVYVGVVDLSGFNLGPDTTLCPGASLTLHVDVPGSSIVWDNGSTSTQRIIASSGNFHATVSVGGCMATDTIQVGYTPLPIVDLGMDTALCAGDTALLTVDPGAATLLWNNGSTANQLPVTTGGNYTATLSLDGCTVTDAVQITVLSPITTIDLGEDAPLCPGKSIALDATLPGGSYLWSNGSRSPVLEVTGPGTYSVLVDGLCIHAADTIEIYEGHCTPRVFLPNAFTPDGDGINDAFAPLVDGVILTWEMQVFNRWGICIFSSTSVGEGWNGTYGGTEAPVGVYVWRLHYTAVTDEGVVQERRTGSVTLVR